MENASSTFCRWVNLPQSRGRNSCKHFVLWTWVLNVLPTHSISSQFTLFIFSYKSIHTFTWVQTMNILHLCHRVNVLLFIPAIKIVCDSVTRVSNLFFVSVNWAYLTFGLLPAGSSPHWSWYSPMWCHVMCNVPPSFRTFKDKKKYIGKIKKTRWIVHIHMARLYKIHINGAQTP